MTEQEELLKLGRLVKDYVDAKHDAALSAFLLSEFSRDVKTVGSMLDAGNYKEASSLMHRINMRKPLSYLIEVARSTEQRLSELRGSMNALGMLV